MKNILKQHLKDENLPIVFNFLTIEEKESAYDLNVRNKVVVSEEFNTSFYPIQLLDVPTIISEYNEKLFKLND